MITKDTLKNCSRGHVFYKSSDCPVCPKCWAGYYKDRKLNDFPKLPAPALRALINADIQQLSDLTKITEAEFAKLHGIGPYALREIRQAIKEKNITFKKD